VSFIVKKDINRDVPQEASQPLQQRSQLQVAIIDEAGKPLPGLGLRRVIGKLVLIIDADAVSRQVLQNRETIGQGHRALRSQLGKGCQILILINPNSPCCLMSYLLTHSNRFREFSDFF